MGEYLQLDSMHSLGQTGLWGAELWSWFDLQGASSRILRKRDAKC